MKTVIEIKNLTKYYGKVRGVENLNLKIKEGETFGFLGPNGAGKTTTIRCIMDFIRPSSGSVFVLGMHSQAQSAKIKKEVGYLAGEVKLYEKLTGEQHIRYIEGFRGKAPLARKLIKKLKFDTQKKTKNLSKGNKQKLALILALMHRPKVIFMDEPTSGLDPILQNEIYETLGEMKKDGATIFFSSHIISEVEKIADRVGIIKDGKLAKIESVEGLVQKKIRNIEIKFKENYNLADFKITGVKKLRKNNNKGLVISYTGDINLLFKKIASYNIADIKMSHASLEDIFIEFYE